MADEHLQDAVCDSLARLEAQRLDPDPVRPSGSGQAAEEESEPTALFPPTAIERLDLLDDFVRRERGHRAAMLVRHHDRRDYWRGRVLEADEARHHIAELRRELEPRPPASEAR